MSRCQTGGNRQQRGITLIEVLLTMVIIFSLSAIAIPMYANSIRQGRETALAAEGKKLYSALMSYHSDNSAFPDEGSFDLATLSPLSDQGYFDRPSSFIRKLENEEMTVYLAPDIDGVNQQFIAVARHVQDSRVIVAIVYTNQVTDDGGWIEGVFVITEQDLADAGI